MNILMIEDDAGICEMLSIFFDQQEGWTYHFIQDGEEGWLYYQAHEDEIDMVILDLNLPSMDGITICRNIRNINKQVPIIMLTARDSDSDQVLGLTVGADDYVTKPFSPVTLIARMEALERRSKQNTASSTEDEDEEEDKDDVIQTRHIRINTKTREAFYDGQEIEGLTPKEFDILALLASHPKQVFTRENLLTQLWEDPFYGDERTVDAHIKKLRHKMDKYGPQLIQTVWGVGYKFDESEVDKD